jgi:hypothetical protein
MHSPSISQTAVFFTVQRYDGIEVAVAEHSKQQHNTHDNKQGFGCLSSIRLAY